MTFLDPFPEEIYFNHKKCKLIFDLNKEVLNKGSVAIYCIFFTFSSITLPFRVGCIFNFYHRTFLYSIEYLMIFLSSGGILSPNSWLWFSYLSEGKPFFHSSSPKFLLFVIFITTGSGKDLLGEKWGKKLYFVCLKTLFFACLHNKQSVHKHKKNEKC